MVPVTSYTCSGFTTLKSVAVFKRGGKKNHSPHLISRTGTDLDSPITIFLLRCLFLSYQFLQFHLVFKILHFPKTHIFQLQYFTAMPSPRSETIAVTETGRAAFLCIIHVQCTELHCHLITWMFLTSQGVPKVLHQHHLFPQPQRTHNIPNPLFHTVQRRLSSTD